MVAHDCSSPCWRVWDGGKKHQHRLSLFLKHQIKVFPSVCFPAFPGPCRQQSRAVTCSQSGMLTDMKEGACTGLSCLDWPIIADQTRLSVLFKPDSSTAGAESRSVSYWLSRKAVTLQPDLWSRLVYMGGKSFYFTSFSCSNPRREFGGHFSQSLM